MSCTKNTTSSSDLYERNVLYAPENILCACRAEDDEQKRRIADVEGENHKRVLANNMSVILGEELRAIWFQHGPSFVLSLLSSVRAAASHTASAIGSTVATKAGVAAQQISSSVTSQAHDLKDKGLETAQGAKSWFSEKSVEAAQWFKDAITNMTLYKKLGNFTGRTNISFAMMEEEAERAFRMNSSSEIYAIQNALNVASLIKALHPELYRPCSDPDIYHTTRLLEERERSLRMNSSDEKFAIKNAMKIASFIKELSPALYRPSYEPNTFYASRLLEERERSLRMNSLGEECAIQNALELAALIKDLHPALRGSGSSHFTNRLLEEAERSRRINEDDVAVDNAKNVSKLVSQKFTPQQVAPKKTEVKVELPVEDRKRPATAAM